MVLALLVGVGAVAIGLPLGWLTGRTDLPFRRAFAVLVVVPLAVPSYVLAFAVVGALGPSGAVADLLAPLGITMPDLYGLPGAVLVLTLATYPYVTLAVRASMARLDPALIDAARTLGEDAPRAFRRVVLPSLAAPVAGGALLADPLRAVRLRVRVAAAVRQPVPGHLCPVPGQPSTGPLPRSSP